MTTMSKIKIKRSTTAGAPGTTLDAGELAYSGLLGTQSNGGDRLYIGINSTQVTIGGKYFTDMMNHTGGILQTDHVSALLTNSSGKIDQVKTTNLTVGGASGDGYDNSIRATNANGGIYLETAGALVAVRLSKPPCNTSSTLTPVLSLIFMNKGTATPLFGLLAVNRPGLLGSR